MYKYQHFGFNGIPSEVAKPVIDCSPDLFLFQTPLRGDIIDGKNLGDDSDNKVDNYGFKNEVTAPRENNNVV